MASVPQGKKSWVCRPPTGRPFTILSYPPWYPPSGACIAGCTSHSASAIFDRPPSICNFSLRGILNVRLTRYAPGNNAGRTITRTVHFRQDLSNFSIFFSLFHDLCGFISWVTYTDNNDKRKVHIVNGVFIQRSLRNSKDRYNEKNEKKKKYERA